MARNPKRRPNPTKVAAAVSAEQLAALLAKLKSRIPGWQTKTFENTVNSVLSAPQKFPKTGTYKWFNKPGTTGFRAPPPSREVGDAVLVAFDRMNAWATVSEETKHDEVTQIRSYFGTESERDGEPNGGETLASATAREISVRRRAPVTAKILFDAALAHGPAILCVIPEAQVSAATNEELHQATLDFVTAGGCYAVMVPAGRPPWPTSGDDRVHNLVKVWRDIYDSAGTVVKKLRQVLKDHDATGGDGAASRVQLVTPKVSDQNDGGTHLNLVRLLPPTLGPAMRPWLLFAGKGPMEDDLAYTCGVVESLGDKLWTRLSVVAPFMRQRMGADGTRTPDREDLRALRNYCFDVLRTWAKNGRQHLGSECISDLWAYADVSADVDS